MHFPTHLICLLALGLSGLPEHAAAAAKIEETILGPTDAGGMFTLSPDGAQAAYLGRKGAKWYVRVDGTDGPEFDEIYKSAGGGVFFPQKAGVWPGTLGGLAGNDAPVLFSLDGGHFAYAGTQGKDYVVIHDGKEVGRGPWELMGRRGLTMTPGGRHVYWTEGRLEQGRSIVRPMIDGQPGPWFQPQGIWTPVFSPDESRFAYALGRLVATGKPALIVDGKEAAYPGQEPVFTADNSLLLTVSHEGGATLLANGKPALPAGVQVSKIVPGPVGHRYAAIVRYLVQNKPVDLLYVDGKQVPGSNDAQDIWFSPDGKRYAAVCHSPYGGPFAMVIDGDAYSFSRIDAQPPYWTPDSSKVIFTAGTDTGSVVVVNDDMFPYSRSLTGVYLPAAGGNYAWVTLGAGNAGHAVMVGKDAVLPPGVYPVSKFMFSPDGSHHGYHVAKFGRGDPSGIVIDGVVQPGVGPANFALWMSSQLTALAPFAFSRDGQHVAYMGIATGGRKPSLYLDGRVVQPDAGLVLYPTFTPDSRHFYWLTDGIPGRPEAETVVNLDGQPTVRAYGYFFKELKNTFVVDRAGVATFLAVDGTVAKRYRITPAPETSVATLLASAIPTATAAVTPAAVPPVSPAASVRPPPVAKPTVAASTSPARPAAAAAGEAAVPTLNWNDFIRRPETRPTSCTVNQDYRFQGGAVVRAGTKVNILEFKPNGLVVGTVDGRTNFDIKPADSDALQVAQAAWAQLTPAQRDLTYPALLRRPDLWPYHLRLALPFDLEGRKLRVGDSVLLLKVEQDQLLVRLEGTDIAFNIAPHESDLMAQARLNLVDEHGAAGRLLEELAGKVINPTNFQPVALEAAARPKYVVLYMGASWCAPCQAFSPQLVKLLKEKAPPPADVALFYLSGDKTPAEMRAYVTKLGIAWPTVRYTSTGQLPAFSSLFGNVIPQLVVTDRHGKVVVDSAKVGTDRALAQLRDLL